METGPIIGIVVACVIVAIAVGVYLWYRARKSNGYHAVPTSDPYFPETDSKPISPTEAVSYTSKSTDIGAEPLFSDPVSFSADPVYSTSPVKSVDTSVRTRPPGTTVYRSADTSAEPTYLEPDPHYEHEDFYSPEFDMPGPSKPYGFLP